MIACLSVSAGNGRTSTIWGKVIDKQTQKPIYGVNVSLKNNPEGLGTISDENGEFRLWNIPGDTAKILISSDGYQNYILDLSSAPKSQENDDMTIIYLNEKSAVQGKLQLNNSKNGNGVDDR